MLNGASIPSRPAAGVMALIYHPGNGPLQEPLRTAGIGILVAGIGLFLMLFGGSRLENVFRSDRNARTTGALTLAVGCLIAWSGGVGWRLRRSWREEAFEVLDPEAGGPGVRPEGRVGVRLRVVAVRPVRVRDLRCSFVPLTGSRGSGRRPRGVGRFAVEAVEWRGRSVSAGGAIDAVFVHRDAGGAPPGGRHHGWLIEVRVRAAGAPDYFQKREVPEQ